MKKAYFALALMFFAFAILALLIHRKYFDALFVPAALLFLLLGLVRVHKHPIEEFFESMRHLAD